jgi:hypothetical protein
VKNYQRGYSTEARGKGLKSYATASGRKS